MEGVEEVAVAVGTASAMYDSIHLGVVFSPCIDRIDLVCAILGLVEVKQGLQTVLYLQRMVPEAQLLHRRGDNHQKGPKGPKGSYRSKSWRGRLLKSA